MTGRFRKMARSKRNETPRPRASRPALEGLEDRMLMYAANGGAWTLPARVTYSFVPDGTSIGGRQVALRPDVIIVKNEQNTFEVEVIELRRFSLKVNPDYRQLVGQIQAARGAKTEAPSMDDKEKQHIREYVTRAKFFIDNINQRRQTMARITQVIVECQNDFLEKGIQSLRPLTRAEVGERIGMHESTGSRAATRAEEHTPELQ